jgi:hypothetical protein
MKTATWLTGLGAAAAITLSVGSASANEGLAGSICKALKGTLDSNLTKAKEICVGKSSDWSMNSALTELCVVFDGTIENPTSQREIAQPACGYWKQGKVADGKPKTFNVSSGLEVYVEFGGFTLFISFTDSWDCKVYGQQTCTFVEAATYPKGHQHEGSTPKGPQDPLQYVKAIALSDGNFTSDYNIEFQYTPFGLGSDGKPDKTKPQDQAKWNDFFKSFKGVSGKFTVKINCGQKWEKQEYALKAGTPKYDDMCKVVK